jgi:enoyl-CoA hydratase/carnithine racemase
MMETLQLTKKDGFAILKLHRSTGNAINLQMMQELSDFFKNAENDPEIGGVILTGNPGIFTAGLDVVELYSLDKEGSYNFWKRFVDLATELVAFSKPLIAAIPGHSPAGGCVFACCADYRIMTEGESYRIGLNEIPVGIVVPERILHLYGFWVGNRNAYQFLMEGRLLSPEEALKAKLIDEITEADEVMNRAEIQMQKYLKLPQQTWRMSKVNLRQGLLEKMQVDFEASYGKAMEQFWSPENRAAMGKLVEKLKK